MSADNRKDLPPISSKNFLEKLREFASTYLGNRGDLLDRGITARDLVDAGIISLRPGWLSNGGRNPISGPGYGLEPAYDVDLTPPPTPTGFTATAAISNLMVQCDPQLYKAGHGHAKSILYGASWISGAFPVFTDAVVLEEFSGTVRSHATNPATTWHLWLKWVTVDGIASTTPAGGTNGVVTRTGEDVALLLTALTGQITESELYGALGSRIDLIDGGVAQPALPHPLVKITALQDGLNQTARMDLDAAAVSILETAITANNTLQTVHDAGININPATGLVEIYGLELAKDHLNTVDIRLNAAEGSLLLKATTVYVDGAIASATLAPADLLLFNSMSARISSAEVSLNSLEGTIVLKASVVDLTATADRVTTAESNIDALNGQMALRVTSADYTARTDGLDARLGSAEVALSSIGDVSAITSMVTQGNKKYRDDAELAQTMLTTLLNGENEAAQSRDTLAFAREELTAYTDAGVLAEASQRLLLAAAVGSNTASIEGEKLARATADGAEASARTTLAARVTDAEGALASKATITQVASAKAEAISAAATVTDTISARLNSGDFAAVQVESAASASAVTGLSAQYTIKQDVAGLISGYGLSSTANNAAPSSAFGVRSNQFFIAPPATASATAPTVNLYEGFCWFDTGVTPNVTRYRSGSGWSLVSPVLPFVVQATPTTVNGQPVSAGLYASNAYFMNGTITNLMVGKLQLDDGHIVSLAVDKLIAGSIAVGQFIQSTSYIAGSQGWRINGDGTAELSGVVVRGTVYASAGLIGGNSISSTGMQSPGYSYNTTGWRLDSNGNIYAKSGRFSGDITGSTGTFSGDLYAAGGTFSGTLTAQAINAVNSINIAGNAVTTSDATGGPAGTIHVNLWIPPNMTMRVVAMAYVDAVYLGTSLRYSSLSAKINGTEVAAVALAPVVLAGGNQYYYRPSATALGKLDVSGGPSGLSVLIESIAEGPQRLVAFGMLK